MGLSAFAGRDAADHVGAVGDHLLRVKGALVASHALHEDRRGFVKQNTHVSLPILKRIYAASRPWHAATAFSAASAKVSAVISLRPLSARILRPSSTLVPASRTTIGTLTSTVS